MTYGDKPFAINDIKLTNLAGDTQVDLPGQLKLTFKERIQSGELRGDSKTMAVQAYADGVEWQLEAGGIPLAAYALITGRTTVVSGVSPNEVTTLSGDGDERFPYFKIYGKSLADGDDDVHVKLVKCKLTSGLQGEFADNAFWVSQCSGVGIKDSSGKAFDIVQNETAAALPSS